MIRFEIRWSLSITKHNCNHLCLAKHAPQRHSRRIWLTSTALLMHINAIASVRQQRPTALAVNVQWTCAWSALSSNSLSSVWGTKLQDHSLRMQMRVFLQMSCCHFLSVDVLHRSGFPMRKLTSSQCTCRALWLDHIHWCTFAVLPFPWFHRGWHLSWWSHWNSSDCGAVTTSTIRRAWHLLGDVQDVVRDCVPSSQMRGKRGNACGRW